MTALEDALRRSMDGQVAVLPAVADQADRAIRGAGVIRRRRLVTGALAALVLLAGTAAALGGHGEPRGLPAPPADRPTVGVTTPAQVTPDAPPVVDILSASVRDGVRIWRAADGKEAALYGRPSTTVVRLDDAWLAVDNEWNLVLLRLDQQPRVLFPGVRQVAVAPGTRSLAWRTDSVMSVGTVTSDGLLVTERSTVAPANPETGPVLYTGKIVLLGGALNRGKDDEHDFWTPADGNYVRTAAANDHVVRVFGRRPDSGRLVGIVENPDGSQCLAELEFSSGMRVLRRSCDLDGYGFAGSLSPSGRRLALDLNERPTGPAHLTVLDLDALFTVPKPAVVSFGVTFAGFGWETEDSLIGTQGRELFRIQPSTGGVTPLRVPGLNPDPGAAPLR
ncbi:hypothetical protein AB0M43_29085 [Longispora sp. NPDC051575]|uniref:hypothetical protein n=1 Tax=Longispora sp. NPDC051575 TaxID=3154943 RepID=UPI00343053E7